MPNKEKDSFFDLPPGGGGHYQSGADHYFDEVASGADIPSSSKKTDNTDEFGEEMTETNFVKCPACGSTMVFDPEKQALSCRHCGNVENFDKNTNVRELELESALKNTESWERDTTIYRCDNCGAKVVLEKNAVSGSCPFCGTAHVVLTSEIAGIKPNALIPFILDAKEASESARKWSKRRIFSPKKFKKRFQPENISGLYTPNFTFDSLTVSYYNGRLGQRRTRTVGTGKNRRTETYIHWYSVRGSLEHFFDDVTISAGSKISQKQLDKLQPFAREKSCVYEKKFLHGFSAGHYDKDINTSWIEARSMMDSSIRSRIISKHGGDVVDYLYIDTHHRNVTYKYILMPVYIGNYRYASKVFNIYINGSTGKVTGKAPLSPLRVGLAAIIAAAIIGIAGYFFIKSKENDNYMQMPLETAQSVSADLGELNSEGRFALRQQRWKKWQHSKIF